MPAAMPPGIFATSVVNGRTSPVTAIIRPVAISAPAASEIVKPSLAPMSASPAVEKAQTTGILYRQDR